MTKRQACLMLRNRKIREQFQVIRKKNPKWDMDFVLDEIVKLHGISDRVYLWKIISAKDAISKLDEGQPLEMDDIKKLNKQLTLF